MDRTWIGFIAIVAGMFWNADIAFAACSNNVKTKGSFFTGKTYSTFETFEGVTKEDAFNNIYARLATDGWAIRQSDLKAGIISAAIQISFSEGHSAPLNVIVQEKGDGLKITASFAIGGGQMATNMGRRLCEIIASATEQ